MAYSENLVFGLKRINVFLPVSFLPAVILSEKLNNKMIQSVLNILKYWVIAVFSYYIILHVFIDERVLSTFVPYVMNDRLGISQFYILFIVLIPFLKSINDIFQRKRLILNIACCCFFTFCILLLANKTALVILLAFTIFKTFNALKQYNKITVSLSAVAIITILVGVIYMTPNLKKRIDVMIKTVDFDIETIITKNSVTFTKNTLEHRLLINYIAISEIKKSFPFGVGIGDTQDVLFSNYKKINFKQGIRNNFNNHNQYIDEFLKSGIFGGFYFLFLMFSLIKLGSVRDQFYSFITIFFAFSCLFESYLFRQHGIIIFSFMIPLFLKYDEQLRVSKEPISNELDIS
ncbi:hypothetical protein ESY86_07885 [Subsaximicrobium wynnwilliamsii]|uniref:O-antigen ligase-related domain-containing protein n=1 Tax=Subsaximicrobium wynnwilliamsii TaxID=291179 RepID=A0A5C6ZK36_9FLAO|nr:O-antigen ligase family protein [Subsaximicrobium wynnwilliamsii]TXD83951.1 hypothetical protein ESY87_08050 [Subsaximicrobium wynnwilliamsii]TXD89691.1 hypothetical protein ESY86_07885 [Subsaximicrobium wynnwilliamsii]TXE01676.1 hypothetical protein ESY88_14950 [Subsaximicrobium wynnwilliamsii]